MEEKTEEEIKYMKIEKKAEENAEYWMLYRELRNRGMPAKDAIVRAHELIAFGKGIKELMET